MWLPSVKARAPRARVVREADADHLAGLVEVDETDSFSVAASGFYTDPFGDPLRFLRVAMFGHAACDRGSGKSQQHGDRTVSIREKEQPSEPAIETMSFPAKLRLPVVPC